MKEILCHGCGFVLHMTEGLLVSHYGEANYWVECDACGWVGILVIDVKRLEPDYSELIRSPLTKK